MEYIYSLNFDFITLIILTPLIIFCHQELSQTNAIKMGAPTNPYTPYAEQHKNVSGPDDGRPSAHQVAKDSNANLKGKTILITGCSSGIGVETARTLYETGATLFLQARDMAKLEKVIDDIVSNAQINKDGPRPQGVEIHLDSLDSVRKGAEDFKKRSGNKLNILIKYAIDYADFWLILVKIEKRANLLFSATPV